MFRILLITLVSFCSVVPFLVLFHRVLDVGNDLAGYISFFLAWVVTPFFLLSIWKDKVDPAVIPINQEDPIIIDQIKNSQSELHRFTEGLSEGKFEAYIKFSYKFGEEIEHVWGSAHTECENTIICSLESSPVGDLPKELHARFSVPIEDLEDWMLVDANGETYGGYSMLAHATIYERDYGKLPKYYVRHLENFHDFTWPQHV